MSNIGERFRKTLEELEQALREGINVHRIISEQHPEFVEAAGDVDAAYQVFADHVFQQYGHFMPRRDY